MMMMMMMNAAQTKSQRDKKNKTLKDSGVDSWSTSGCGEDLKAVAGFIESDRFTLCGGVIAPWGGLSWKRHCVFRTRCKNVIAIVNSGQCKWCEGASSTSVQESDLDKVRTRTYLRGVFQLTLSEAVKLSELISELTKTKGGSNSCPFIGTPPYCTVENVTHISGLALSALFEFDKEFVWGDNLTFNTRL